MNTITSVTALEVLDSRGVPTLQARVQLKNGACGQAMVPSGASTGKFEATELRDGDKTRYFGKGVRQAVQNVNGEIAEALLGLPCEQRRIDGRLCNLDGTENKSRLGANAILAVSLAATRAAANAAGLPLYRYLGGLRAGSLPTPAMNILNGGAHAKNTVDIQEFMIVPIGAERFSEALRWGSEIYRTLGQLLAKDGYATGVGDEGGYAPDLPSDEAAIEYILKAIAAAGYTTRQVGLALDVAGSEWYDRGVYRLPKRGRQLQSEELAAYITQLVHSYPILSVEDPLAEEDWVGWKQLTKALGGRVMLVGDDLFVTNRARLQQGIDQKAANAILIKLNQIGTLTETLEVIALAQQNGYRVMVSHRSGETEDPFIADLAVAVGSPYIKAGAPCRSDRVAKYNRLLQIQAQMQ